MLLKKVEVLAELDQGMRIGVVGRHLLAKVRTIDFIRNCDVKFRGSVVSSLQSSADNCVKDLCR